MAKERGIKLIHSKKLFFVIIILIILFITLIYFAAKNNSSTVTQETPYNNSKNTSLGNAITPLYNECNQDSDCVPASCCHSESCVNSQKKPSCDKVFCTQECSSILDCGKGKCLCVNNKCEVEIIK